MDWIRLVGILALSFLLVGRGITQVDDVGRGAGNVGRRIVRLGDNEQAVLNTTTHKQDLINEIRISPEKVYDGSCLVVDVAKATGQPPTDAQIQMLLEEDANASAAAKQYGIDSQTIDPQSLDEKYLGAFADRLRRAEMSANDYVEIADKACDADKVAF